MGKLDDFMNMAIGHRGYSGEWVWANAPQDRGHAWCAAFVWTCARLTGCGNTIIPHNYAARMMCKLTYQKSGMRWMSRAYGGPASFKPRRGDLIFFRWNPMPGAEWWVANHVGIVINTEGNYVNTIEGNRHGNGNNWASIVDYRRCALTYDKILCYVRPQWPGASADEPDPTPPYEQPVPITPTFPVISIGGTVEPNTANDASIREVGYWSGSGFSTTSSNIPLSVINYTSGLSQLVAAANVSPNYPASECYILDNLSSLQRAISQQLVLGGYTMASAIGILGNIQRESNFNPGLVSSNGSGLCRWKGSKLNAMQTFVGLDWRSNATGQIDFLLHDIQSKTVYAALNNTLVSSPNSEAGVVAATDAFFRRYGSVSYSAAESTLRSQCALQLWRRIIQQL